MKIIWLDVSTVMVWHRPAVGIVRVEAECAAYGLQRLEAAVGSVRFCRFHATRGYQEVSAAELRVALAGIQGRSAAVPKNEPPPPHVVMSRIRTPRLHQRGNFTATRPTGKS